jgi:PAS domain S-box-containing protein
MTRELKRWVVFYVSPAFVAALLYLALVFGFIIPTTKTLMFEMKKENIRFLAQSIWSILQSYQNRVESGDLELELAQTRALNHIRTIRYGADGKDYFWIHGVDLVMKMHPYVSELEGKDLSKYQDTHGNRLFVEMCRTVETADEGYVRYFWQFKDLPQEKQKESFVKIFRPWGWIIGTGAYYDDIEKNLEPVVRAVVRYSLAIFTVILGLLVWLSIISFRSELERSRMEREQQKTAEKYRATFETTGTAMFIIEKDAGISLANKRFFQLLEYGESEVIGKRFMDLFHPDFRPGLLDFQANLLGEGSFSPKKMEAKLVSRDGRILDVIASFNLMSESRTIASFLDITELKETHKQLRSEMDKRIKMEAQLQQTQKMNTIGILAGGLAHNFNNVLAGIIGTVSLIKLKGPNIPYERMIEHLTIIDESALRAADMVRQMLTFSRKNELNVTTVNLQEILQQVARICGSTFEKCVEITVDCGQDLRVNADRAQIEQVVLNLCINSYHAMTIMREKGEKIGGKLFLRSEILSADKVFCQNHPEAKPAEYCVISVRDTGVGMTSEVVPKVFDPFFTTKDKNKGTGLGLTMVYNIVRQHEGFVEVYSEPGIGSTFNVYIPRYLEVFPETHSSADELKMGTGVILIIDDEAIVRYTAQKMLEECGYSVLTAEDGLEGIQLFNVNREKINLVLLDMIMPRMSGNETFHLIRKTDSAIPIVLASGFRQDERIDELMKSGLKHFIHKPYTIEKLSEIVQKALEPQSPG